MRLLVLSLRVPALLATVACARPSIEGEALDDGRHVADLSSRATNVYVLAFSPEECFRCSVDIGQWMLSQPADDHVVYLVLTRRPDAKEQPQFVVRRLKVEGTLRSHWWQRDLETPSMYHFRNGQLVRSGAIADSTIRAYLAEELGR